MSPDPKGPAQSEAVQAPSTSLSLARGWTGAAMAIERGWPLVLPLILALCSFAILSWFGIFRLLGDWSRIGLVIAFALTVLAAIAPLRRFRAPLGSEIDRRIEARNHLEHAPIRSRTDRLAQDGDPFAQALWREHRRRLSARLGALDGDMPRTRLPERDPWGLRAVAFLLLPVAFAFSLGPLGGSLTDAFRAPALALGLAPRIDAWVTPPAYTGRAPIFMTASANSAQTMFSVPQGSEVAVRMSGTGDAPTLSFLDAHTAQEMPFEQVATVSTPGSTGFAGRIESDGLVTLTDGDTELASWSFNVIPDLPPQIGLSEDPRQALNGALELRYEVTDDYGAVEAHALFEPADASDSARPLYDVPEMPLSLPRRNAEPAAARTVRDLTEHPFAGRPMKLTLEAEDAAGQTGRSDIHEMTLPERPFSDPLARALIEQRRLLAADAGAKPRVLDLMDAITLRPEDTFASMSHFLGVASARSRLSLAADDEALRSVVDYLWEIAVTIEDGTLSAAERRLRMAQEALRDALEEGADDERIEELMAELREAMQDFLREFAERAMQNPQMSMPMDGQELRPGDLERMLDQIENLAKSGARDEAQQMLSELQDMMNNLQAGRQQGQQGGEQSEMRQQMDALGDIMRRQQEMMNQTFGMQRERAAPQPGQPGQMTPEEFAEALRGMQEDQGQLQQDLQTMMEALEGMGMQPGEGFGEAGEAMGRAGDALGQAQGERAVGEQGQALEELRRGAQDMMQQMQQAMEGEQGGGQPGGRSRQGADRDPLGRPRATTGPDFGDSVRVPDEIDVQRARRILEEIRERLGNALSPQLERDYLERLLEMR